MSLGNTAQCRNAFLQINTKSRRWPVSGKLFILPTGLESILQARIIACSALPRHNHPRGSGTHPPSFLAKRLTKQLPQHSFHCFSSKQNLPTHKSADSLLLSSSTNLCLFAHQSKMQYEALCACWLGPSL